MPINKYDSADIRPMIFVSYSHNDVDKARSFVRLLEKEGFFIWFDETRIEAGDNFHAQIDQNLKNCWIFLSLLSRSYVGKPYCRKEFDIAQNCQRNIVTVCLDDVNPRQDAAAEYMFNNHAGYSVMNLGVGMPTEDALQETVSILKGQTLFRYALLSDAERAKVPFQLKPHTALLDRLRRHLENTFAASGNYFLDKIHQELFPNLKDEDLRMVWQDTEKNQVPLHAYLSRHSRRHLLLLGDGGMGKTVSMIQVCKRLLEEEIPTVYIPLRSVDFSHDTLISYIQRVVCNGQGYWNQLYAHYSTPYADKPNLVILMDGVNELPSKQQNEFLQRDIHELLSNWVGAQIVLSSRYDFRTTEGLEQQMGTLTMLPLETARVEQYLAGCGLPPVSNGQVLQLLRNPLLLSLYANAEHFREKYNHPSGIELAAVPDTAGKIIGNFLKTQLFRSATDRSMELPEYQVTLEFYLPVIAHHMVCQQNSYAITDAQILRRMRQMGRHDLRKEWYQSARLDQALMACDRYDYQWNDLLHYNLATKRLNFLNKNSDGLLSFLHQNFRDYFAAHYLVNELQAALDDRDFMEDVEDFALGLQCYSDEILQFAADIAEEELATPRFTGEDWEFPGKRKPFAPSRLSLAEQTLPQLRGRDDEEARTAVNNLMRILCLGRKHQLAWCDFSRLDLRGCSMNSVKFVLWHKDKLYPSRFDNAWMDRPFLLADGHSANVSAICTDGEDLIFSGDTRGTVRVYDLKERQWRHQLQLQNAPVVDLTWDPANRRVAILYASALFFYDPQSRSTVQVSSNPDRIKGYRYVRFSPEGQPEISYDLEPLLYYDVKGNPLPCNLNFDVAASAARWHPHRQEYIRSMPHQMVASCIYNPQRRRWDLSPGLQRKREILNEERRSQNQREYITFFLRLREDCGLLNGKITALCYHPSGSRFLVAILNQVLEYDTESMTLLQKRVISKSVQCLCYGKDDSVFVGSGATIAVLNKNFALQLMIPGNLTNDIAYVSQSPDGEHYFVFSSTGIKQLNTRLQVQRIREVVGSHRKISWGKDRLTGKLLMLRLPDSYFPNGSRYDFETNELSPLGWRYQLLDPEGLPAEAEQQLHNLKHSLLMVEKQPPHRTLSFTNYRGLWIFGCSFRGIRGTMSESRNLQLLEQNGGIIDE